MSQSATETTEPTAPAPGGTDDGPDGAANEVVDALDALAAGTRTIEDVAEFFRTRTWPPTQAGEPKALSNDDVEPPPPGSFFDVSCAYTAGRITADQYARLAEAAAASSPAPGSAAEPADPAPVAAAADPAPVADPAG